jgi:hypothetical protein
VNKPKTDRAPKQAKPARPLDVRGNAADGSTPEWCGSIDDQRLRDVHGAGDGGITAMDDWEAPVV